MFAPGPWAIDSSGRAGDIVLAYSGRLSMFRDDAQLARACRALLETVRLERLWTDSGPTDEATSLCDRDGGPLSSGERVMVLAVWALWNGGGALRFADITQLSGKPLEALGSFLAALSSGSIAVDSWLRDHPLPEAIPEKGEGFPIVVVGDQMLLQGRRLTFDDVIEFWTGYGWAKARVELASRGEHPLVRFFWNLKSGEPRPRERPGEVRNLTANPGADNWRWPIEP
jgi:hypothetical protein